MLKINLNPNMQQFSEFLRKEIGKYLRESSLQDELALNPNIPVDILAKRIINRACVKTALVGGGTGMLGLPGLIMDSIPVTKIQLKLLCDISMLYGIKKEINFEDIDTIFKLFALSFGIKGGATLAGRSCIKFLGKSSARATAKKLGLNLTKKGLLHSVPVMAIVSSGALNYIATRQLGKIAVNHFKVT